AEAAIEGKVDARNHTNEEGNRVESNVVHNALSIDIVSKVLCSRQFGFSVPLNVRESCIGFRRFRKPDAARGRKTG
ncbi:MAG: hypothetical protein AAF668_13840, partial [Pseudomonadota bacterium]